MVTVEVFANSNFHRSTGVRTGQAAHFDRVVSPILVPVTRHLSIWEAERGRGRSILEPMFVSAEIAPGLLRLKPAVYAAVTHTSRFGLGGLGNAACSYGRMTLN